MKEENEKIDEAGLDDIVYVVHVCILFGLLALTVMGAFIIE